MGPPASQTAAFVGRERELGELRTAFDDAVNGNGRLIMVVGEPGIGKTALCKELARYVEEQGGTTLIGHCYEEGSLSLPYLPFVQAMRSYVVSRSEDDLREDLGDAASHVARIMPEIQDKLGVEPVAPIDPEDDRYRLLNGVTTFVTNASKSRPLSIVLEDLHDADSGTLEMLTYLSGFLSDTNAMVVGTYRDVEVDRAHPLSSALVELRRASPFARVPLRGLGLEDVRRMMTDVSGDSITEHLAVTVHDQTEGNPLFVQEVARHLREEQVLATGDSEVELRVPESVRDVIGKRLSRLSKECNQMLAVASVIGREFDLDILLEVSSLSEDDLYTQLEEAQGASVVEESPGLRGGLSYRFSHAMIRETLYEEIFAPLRIRLHQRVGRAVEGAYAGQLEQHAAELAEHFANSSGEEDLTRALEYSEIAARHAQSVYSYGEAAWLLEQALKVQQLLDLNDTARRCDLLIALGEVLMPAGESLRVYEDVAPEAFALAESLGDNDRVSRICQLAVVAAQRYSFGLLAQEPEFLTWTERFDRSAAPGTRQRVLADLAMSIVRRMTHEDYGGTWTLRKRALELSKRLQDPELFTETASLIIVVPWAPQHQEERLALAREIADRYRDSGRGNPTNLTGFPLLHLLAWAYLEMGERDRAEELWGELKERATRTQDANLLIVALHTEVMVATLDGRLEDAVAAAKRLGDRGEELGIPVVGRWAEEGGSFYPSLYLGRTEHLLAHYPQRSRIKALILAHAGRAGEALELSRRYMQEGRKLPDGEADEIPSPWLLFALNIAVLVGDRETAEVLYPRITPLGDIALLGWLPMEGFNCISRILGGAAALLGDPQSARMHYDKALEMMGKIRFRPEIALIRLEMVELLLDNYPDPSTGSGQASPEGLEHLDFAITELRDMKMQPALDRAVALQAGLEAKAVDTAAYPDGLTQREVEVLRHIIAGATNQDIADALFITTNTVANHVKNILSKSNTENRTGAAAYGIRQGLAED